MDKTTKALLIACFILVGALGFTIGALVQIQEKIPSLLIPHNIKNPANMTDTVQKEENKSNPAKNGDWNVSYCPYCGAPFAYVYTDDYPEPRYVEGGYKSRGAVYRVYECGHVVYVGENLVGEEYITEFHRAMGRG